MNSQLRELITALNKVFKTHRKCYLQESQNYGLYVGQPQVLDYIRSNPGCTQTEIANAIGVSPASIAFSTKRLQAAGVLMKQVNSLDMRRNKLYVTSEGIEALDRFENNFNELTENMFDGFTDEELHLMASFVERINTNLDKMTRKG